LITAGEPRKLNQILTTDLCKRRHERSTREVFYVNGPKSIRSKCFINYVFKRLAQFFCPRKVSARKRPNYLKVILNNDFEIMADMH